MRPRCRPAQFWQVRARGRRPFHGLDNRVVAAGVEDHEPQASRRLDCTQNTVERKGFVINIKIARQLCIDRDQVILPVHLNAVPRVVDDSDIGISRRFCKIANGASQVGIP
jgi:hypothetical protein